MPKRLPIIMFSTLTERGAESTLDALSLGATDYVTKPSNSDKGSAGSELRGDHAAGSGAADAATGALRIF